jgi:hypothetical protein
MKSAIYAAPILLRLAAAGPVSVVHAAAVTPQDAGLGPFSFTSTYNLVATPEGVVNAENAPAPGEAGAMGFYNYGINSELDIICYVSTFQHCSPTCSAASSANL